MLMDNIHEDVTLLEQSTIPGAEQEAEVADAFPEAEALKKYELIQQLVALKNRLKISNIYSDNLETALKFSSELSYTTLLVISNYIVDELKIQLSELEANEQKQE